MTENKKVERLFLRVLAAAKTKHPSSAAWLGMKWQRWFSRRGYKRYPNSTDAYLYGGAGRSNLASLKQ